MNKSDFNFDLPEHLIAQHPCAKRTDSRLLVLDDGKVQHCQFRDFINFIEPGDVLVFNNTKVIPARIFGRKESGGKVEVLIERIVDAHSAWVHIRASKAPKPGTQLILDGNINVCVEERKDDLFYLHCNNETAFIDLLNVHGHMPLPPYITRADANEDKERYQTVYAKEKGAVAAPTAGLHFDDALLEKLKNKGVQLAFVTLHVGAGTFQPVRTENIKDHQMHAEFLRVPQEVCDVVNATRAAGKRVLAIGTTSVRCLETAFKDGQLQPYEGDTNIFIYPGYQFKCVDALLTNFHLPESTLIMLVSALAGMDNIKNAYQAAIDEEYRFFSYGDAMLILK